MKNERLNIVIVGHVDHGKSTVIGRLLADTGSLPEGKLQQVQEMCKRTSRPFEYAFLLDALKDEQAQGITIDIARCFFKTAKREYLILDAPGHIEFLKNMVTGAAHADAALLVIDAHEGIQDNSKRHGYLVSMLGIKHVVVLVNKMDLVHYDQAVFRRIVAEYTSFLKDINVEAIRFIPISAMNGENIVSCAASMPWHDGGTVLDHVESFEKTADDAALPFRMPVQDIYKFTQMGDDRRIIAGTILTGAIAPGDEVVFLPSGKKTTIKSIEYFNGPVKTRAAAGEAVGLTMTTQIYISPGEMMVKVNEKQPTVTNRFRANIFWIGREPLVKGKTYKLKIAAAKTPVKVVEINTVLDATTLRMDREKKQVDRNEVAECVFETAKPVAFDLTNETEKTARFVLVDAYEIAGGGIILNGVTPGDGSDASAHHALGAVIVFTGSASSWITAQAMILEKKLIHRGRKVTFWNINDIVRLGEVAKIMADAGYIFISAIAHATESDLEKLQTILGPHELTVIDGEDLDEIVARYSAPTSVDV